MEQSSIIPIKSSTHSARSSRSGLFVMMLEDIRCALHRDPAARNWFEVLINYSGLHAIWFYRLTHFLWIHKLFFPARALSQLARWLTGIEIHPGAVIGRRFFIDHGMGVVIGETAEVGDDVTLYHGVTLGGVSLEKGKRHPTLGDKVVVGAGAKILGDITIGSGSRVGANAVVVKTVPPESVVVGIPGQIVKRREKRTGDLPDLHHDRLPDTIGKTLEEVIARLNRVEAYMQMGENGSIQAEQQKSRIDADISV